MVELGIERDTGSRLERVRGMSPSSSSYSVNPTNSKTKVGSEGKM
ncbi:hypothetical protein HanIR_Chr11g0554981 [Helianthus annuus]|nr:hypothetical protein HanIR_Chr11g0554981 [Helianthus annuus]